jgi:hypothetical protein
VVGPTRRDDHVGERRRGAIPFSLENLRLKDPTAYAGQTNPRYVLPEDEAVILPYIRFDQAKRPRSTRSIR